MGIRCARGSVAPCPRFMTWLYKRFAIAEHEIFSVACPNQSACADMVRVFAQEELSCSRGGVGDTVGLERLAQQCLWQLLS